jgi:hypothetical protein
MPKTGGRRREHPAGPISDGVLNPGELAESSAKAMPDELVRVSAAFATLRRRSIRWSPRPQSS